MRKLLLASVTMGVLMLLFLGLPASSLAAGDILLTISDPDLAGSSVASNDADKNSAGAAVNSALSIPVVTFGDNKALGTFRITGKDGVAPLAPGNKIKVTLPPGTCFMRAPTAADYQNYVQWTALLDSRQNQQQNNGSTPLVRFIEGASRSITVEISRVVPENEVLILDFVFNQDDYSKVRVSRLLDLIKEYEEISGDKITRLEFMKNLADITVSFPSCPFNYVRDKTPMNERFTDIDKVAPKDLRKIKPLSDSGMITGNLLRPDDGITKAEAEQLISGLIPAAQVASPAMVDTVKPDRHLLSDEQYLTKGEALAMLLETFESYAYLW